MLSALLYALRILLFCGLICALPMGAGLAFWKRNERGAGVTFLYGVCVTLALFALVYLPILFTTRALSHVVFAYFMASAALAGFGFWRFYRGGGRLFRRLELKGGERTLFIILCVLVLLQSLRMVVCFTNLTGDDATYLAESISAVQTNTLWATNAETGAAGSDWRNFQYTLAPWSIYIAAFSSLLGIHPAILTRTVLPAPLTLLFYLVTLLMFRYIFRGDRKKVLTALIITVLYTFVLSSAQSVQYFWMSYLPWYGKAVAPSILCPAALLFFLLIFEEEDGHRRHLLWLGVFFGSAAAAAVAATGAVIMPIILACWGLAFVIRRRDASLIWKLALCVSPCLAQLAGIYLL